MKIFVTGGTGFIGSHFLKQALEAGHEVTALRRSISSAPKILLEHDPEWLDKKLTEVTVDDLRGFEAIVHLSAHSANVPYDTIENCILANVVDPLGLFRNAAEAGIDKFIVAGSCFEYGRSGERYENIPVEAPLEPTSSYPASKAAASVAFYAFACENNVKLITLRIFQVYGEGELESRFWPSLRKAALSGADMKMTSGQQVRDFINVTSVAKTFVESLERDDLENGIPQYENVGSGNPQKLADFAESQWNSFSAKGSLLLGEIPQRRNEVMRFVPEIKAI
jgi:nucleoside-diphosphate-sugar epimerase